MQENEAEDWSDEIDAESGFDPSLFVIEAKNVESSDQIMRIITGCKYNGKQLMFSGIDKTIPGEIVIDVLFNKTRYNLIDFNRLPAEVLKGALVRQVCGLVKLCVIDGVSYYGGWHDTEDSMLNRICISVADNVRCDSLGRYLCSKILMPDGLSCIYEVDRDDSLDVGAYMYDGLNNEVIRC